MPEQDNPNAAPSLKTALDELLPGVNYPSESDEPVEFVELNLPPEAEPLNERSAGEFLAFKRNRHVEELSVDEFFEPITDVQDWFSDEENRAAKQMTQVRELLEKDLTDLKVFKIGHAEKDLYLLGLTKEGQRVGLKTKVTETGDD
jgi:hypothetical protein